MLFQQIKKKLINKLPLILLCTIRIDEGLLIAVSYHSKVATGRPVTTNSLTMAAAGAIRHRHSPDGGIQSYSSNSVVNSVYFG